MSRVTTFYPSFDGMQPMERLAVMIHEASHFDHPWQAEAGAYGRELTWIDNMLDTMDQNDPNRAVLEAFRRRLLDYFQREHGEELRKCY
jgi:hypothetical protein